MPWTSVYVFRATDGSVPLIKWLQSLAETNDVAFDRAVAHIQDLERMGYELRRPAVDNLGDGIWELRFRVVTVQYRILYFFCGKNALVLSHGVTKERKIKPKDIALAKRRKALVTANFAKHTA